MNLSKFLTTNFYEALESFFNDLKVPVSKIASEAADAKDIISNNYKPENEAHKLINKVYFLGMVNEQAFDGTKNNESLESVKALKEDYDGILIFGIELNSRRDGLLPTRSQLAEISRAFNREFNYTPVTIVFKYGKLLAFANSERLKYKQEWREGEKIGKVSLLRDINVEVPHSGHLRILQELEIPITGKNAVDSYEKLYKYWQEVFSVSLLNKKFYKELSNWYFWAIKHVVFPNRPTAALAHEKGIELDELIREHNATNVIRLLTRILFVWFIKEKRLIPEELFDLNTLQTDILKEISPYHETDGFFASANKESVYYKAILQNLFFASLNCPIKADDVDARTRGFRLNNHYGQDRGNDWRYRYENYFKNPDAFLKMINKTVPFLNGGLFECLDEKLKNIYIDGFSDQMTKGELLVVPDYLFFGTESFDDISEITGIKDSQNKQAEVKGLINILKSYKFTITENTPIEEDIELDPELLGKVFENLLASYNPETKTTARKQTGSFYTPREIVNYMVDESLIAYLKNKIVDTTKEADLDVALHNLISYSDINPFADDKNATKEIIDSLDKCKILDPACGSGAFPMGVLQKMVHILQKLDPKNELWHELQLQKAMDETRTAYQIQDKKEREKQILEINEAFDQSINDPDYARKLYLIENCIYGVDIQPIAIQISKLRFFISLVSDQKPNSILDNFGIKPLPNLETRFVAANTLVGKDKVDSQLSLFETQELVKVKNELKYVRHKSFGARSKETKLKYRHKDLELRCELSRLLVENGWPNETADKLAKWDPYDQNASSSFFDTEWMFDIKDGFDVVIGNPPYIKEYTDSKAFDSIKGKKYYQGKMDIWYYFACVGIDQLCKNGILCFIATNNWTTNAGASILRSKILEETKLEKFIDFGSYMIFESAAIQTMIFVVRKIIVDKYLLDYRKIKKSAANLTDVSKILNKEKGNYLYETIDFKKDKWLNKNFNFENEDIEFILELIKSKSNFALDSRKEVAQGIVPPQDFLNKSNKNLLGGSYVVGEGIFNLSNDELNLLALEKNELELIKPFYSTNELRKYYGNSNNNLWIIYTGSEFKDERRMVAYPNLKKHLDRFKTVITSDNKPYGLHRARNENFFKGEKIVSLRKCATPTFTYTDFDCYVSQTFFVIKSHRINLKYLTGLLNSKLIAFWLWHRGKLQGDYFQVDKEPLLEIPLIKDESKYRFLSCLVDFIIYCNRFEYDSKIFEQILDAFVFNLYFPVLMQENEIDVLEIIESEIDKVLQNKEFEKLTDTEKKQVIESLNKTWYDPENEVVKRISQFKEKSPNILKIIMES